MAYYIVTHLKKARHLATYNGFKCFSLSKSIAPEQRKNYQTYIGHMIIKYWSKFHNHLTSLILLEKINLWA